MVASAPSAAIVLLFFLSPLRHSVSSKPLCPDVRYPYQMSQSCVVRESLALVNCSPPADDATWNRERKTFFGSPALCALDGDSARISEGVWKELVRMNRSSDSDGSHFLYWCIYPCPPRRGIVRVLSREEFPRLNIRFVHGNKCLNRDAELIFSVDQVNSSTLEQWWITEDGEQIFSFKGHCRGCYTKVIFSRRTRKREEKSYVLHATAKIRETGLRLHLSKTYAVSVEAITFRSTNCTSPPSAAGISTAVNATAITLDVVAKARTSALKAIAVVTRATITNATISNASTSNATGSKTASVVLLNSGLSMLMTATKATTRKDTDAISTADTFDFLTDAATRAGRATATIAPTTTTSATIVTTSGSNVTASNAMFFVDRPMMTAAKTKATAKNATVAKRKTDAATSAISVEVAYFLQDGSVSRGEKYFPSDQSLLVVFVLFLTF